MTDIVWEDPPHVAYRSPMKSWALFVEELKKHPGKWAVAFNHPKQTRMGTQQTRLKAAGCEATSRKQPDWPSA